MTPEKKNAGHRQRLRDKFLKSGLDGFHDYEIIELLLTLGTPRKDCKQSAKNALQKFGSLKAVLEADPSKLKEIKGIGDKNVFGLKITQAVSRRFLSDRVINKDFIRSSDEVLDYLKHNLRDKNREIFLVIFLNGRNQIIKMVELFQGSLSTSMVYPREVIKQALDNGRGNAGFCPQPSQRELKSKSGRFEHYKKTERSGKIHRCIHSRSSHYCRE